MGHGVYVGVDGQKKKVKKIYVGVDGQRRKVKKGYVGVDGKPHLFYSAEPEIIDLYNAGSTNTSVVGSWKTWVYSYNNNTDYSGGDVTFNSSYITLEAWGNRNENNGSSRYGIARIYSQNQVDLTNVESITIEFTNGEGASTSVIVSSAYNTVEHYPEPRNENTGNGTLTINTSSLSGLYYICISNWEYGDDENYGGWNSYTNIKRIYMKKNI